MGTAAELPQTSHADLVTTMLAPSGHTTTLPRRSRTIVLMRSTPSIKVSSLNVFGEGFVAGPSAPRPSTPPTRSTLQATRPVATSATHTTGQYSRCARGTIASAAQAQSADLSRTQHKLLLQRQLFLADDKNHLEHPENMRRLTKETVRINREYRCVRQFEDPLADSLRRVAHHHPLWTQPSCSTSPSSSSLSSLSWSSITSSTHSLCAQQQSRLNLADFRRHSSTSVPSVHEQSKVHSILGRLHATLYSAPSPSRRHSQLHPTF